MRYRGGSATSHPSVVQRARKKSAESGPEQRGVPSGPTLPKSPFPVPMTVTECAELHGHDTIPPPPGAAERGRLCGSVATRVVGGCRPVDEDAWFVTDGPGVVSGWADHEIARADLAFGAVVHPDAHPSRHAVSDVGRLAAARAGDRLDVGKSDLRQHYPVAQSQRTEPSLPCGRGMARRSAATVRPLGMVVASLVLSGIARFRHSRWTQGSRNNPETKDGSWP